MAGNRDDLNKSEQKIRKDERKRVKGKRRAKGTIYTMFAALLAFLISIFGGFFGLNPVGFYGDGSGSHSIIQSNDRQQLENEEPISMAEEKEAGPIQIIVDDKTYVYEGQVYDLAGITEVIQGMETARPIELVDKYAVNLTFEEVQKVLAASNMEYNIVEDYE